MIVSGEKQIHYCAGCNAEQWHVVTTRTARDHRGVPYQVPTAFSCRICAHQSDSGTDCLHTPVCVVDPARRGANTTPAILTELRRQRRRGRTRALLWAIPTLILMPAIVALCVVAVRFVRAN